MAAEPKFVNLTPKMATAMIESHESTVRDSGLHSLNRVINDNTVKQYEQDMKNGKWVRNGESIKVAASGRVLDGQHRLWACVNAEVPFPTLLVTGFSEDEVDAVFTTTDIGRVKIPSAFLAASGIQYAGFVSPATRYIMCYQLYKSMTKKHMLTTHEIVAFAKDHSDRLVDSAAYVSKFHAKLAPGSLLTAWHYLFYEKHQEQAAKFIQDLTEGVGLTKGDPVHAMRERIIQSKGSKTSRLRTEAIFALGLHMWNDRRKNVNRQVIKAQQLDYANLPRLV